MKRRLLALILSLSLLVGLMPVAAMAVGEGAGTDSTVADTSTLTSWESVFGKNGALSTKDIGRIWTDKTVSTDNVTLSGDIGPDVTIDKEMDADFLVGLSALGSAAKITGETSIPTDTMIVLDVSPKMQTSVDAMLTAANAALKSLLESNPNNRVGVVTYDNTAAVILPLGTYLNYSGESNEPILSLSGSMITAKGVTKTGTVGGSFGFDNGAYRNYQFGMYFAMQQLVNATDRQVEINGVQVSRTPVVIALASGEPEVGSSTFISVNENQGNRDIGPETALYNKASAHIAQTFVALLTAGYWKDQVTQAYYGEDGDKAARVYTVAVGDLTYNSDASLAEAALNPVALTESSIVGSEDTNLYDALADYNNGRVTLRRAEGRYGVSTEDVTISKANNNDVIVSGESETIKHDGGKIVPLALSLVIQSGQLGVFDHKGGVVGITVDGGPAGGHGAVSDGDRDVAGAGDNVDGIEGCGNAAPIQQKRSVAGHRVKADAAHIGAGCAFGNQIAIINFHIQVGLGQTNDAVCCIGDGVMIALDGEGLVQLQTGGQRNIIKQLDRVSRSSGFNRLFQGLISLLSNLNGHTLIDEFIFFADFVFNGLINHSVDFNGGTVSLYTGRRDILKNSDGVLQVGIGQNQHRAALDSNAIGYINALVPSAAGNGQLIRDHRGAIYRHAGAGAVLQRNIA